MKLNSVITDWNMRDEITKGMELREELRKPLSKRKVVKPSRLDPCSLSISTTHIQLGDGGYKRVNIDFSI